MEAARQQRWQREKDMRWQQRQVEVLDHWKEKVRDWERMEEQQVKERVLARAKVGMVWRHARYSRWVERWERKSEDRQRTRRLANKTFVWCARSERSDKRKKELRGRKNKSNREERKCRRRLEEEEKVQQWLQSTVGAEKPEQGKRKGKGKAKAKQRQRQGMKW